MKSEVLRRKLIETLVKNVIEALKPQVVSFFFLQQYLNLIKGQLNFEYLTLHTGTDKVENGRKFEKNENEPIDPTTTQTSSRHTKEVQRLYMEAVFYFRGCPQPLQL